MAALRRAPAPDPGTALFGRGPTPVLTGAATAFGARPFFLSATRRDVPAAVDGSAFFATRPAGRFVVTVGDGALARATEPTPDFARVIGLCGFFATTGFDRGPELGATTFAASTVSTLGVLAGARFFALPSLVRRTELASIDTGG